MTKILGSHSNDYEDTALQDQTPCSLVKLHESFRWAAAFNFRIPRYAANVLPNNFKMQAAGSSETSVNIPLEYTASPPRLN
jgi:hypothetical protein